MSLTNVKTKVEKDKKEDELTASISKTMTVDKLKTELTKNKIVYSTAKKKSDFVDLYISNGLHNKASNESLEAVLSKAESLEAASLEEVKEEAKEVEEAVAANKELVMSISIFGHGCEDLMTPWAAELPISTYFKNNVRVYSRSCVPDVNSIGNPFRNEDIIKDVQSRFSAVPKGETAAIVRAYADDVRDDYIRNIAFAKFTKDPVSLTRGFDKLSDINNLSKASNLSTFLCNKEFSFYIDDKKEKIAGTVFQHSYNTLGIHVTDIRLKKTAGDGSVSYEQIFSPKDPKYSRMDLSNFNLIYKNGLTYLLKDIMGRRDLVKPALDIFGLTGKKDRVMDVSLEQIYQLFQLLEVKYANIMDYTCRSCSIGRLSQDLTNTIYSVEQRYRIKPVAFGKRSVSRKRIKSNRIKRKKHSNKKQKAIEKTRKQRM
jgi:hypothetical protein